MVSNPANEKFVWYCNKTASTNGRCPLEGEDHNMCINGEKICPYLMLLHVHKWDG